jgi:hypothetical protein
MGHVRHHVIVVTCFCDKDIKKAHQTALAIFAPDESSRGIGQQVSQVTAPDGNNGYMHFCVFPEGSKYGWPQAERGETCRNAFVAWLDSQRYEDGSSPMEWFEAFYGSDDASAEVTRSTWKKHKEKQ